MSMSVDIYETLRLHALWRAGDPSGRRMVLRYSGLRRSIPRGSNLSYSDLRDCDLSGSDLRGSDLSGSNLRGSDLRDCDLRDCDLSGSNLRGSDLSGSALSGTGVVVIGAGPYHGCVTPTHVHVGCVRVKVDELLRRDTDDTVGELHREAAEWWEIGRGLVLAAIEESRKEAERA